MAPVLDPVGMNRIGAARLTCFALLLAVASVWVTPPLHAGSPYAENEIVQITGTVTDASGRPIGDIQVFLEASRKSWSFKKVNFKDKGRKLKDNVRWVVRTDDSGRYTIDWKWHDYYNHFEVVVGHAEDAAAESIDELGRTNLSKLIKQGSPVVANFALAGAVAPEPVGVALTTDSADQRKVLDDLGPPDRIEEFDYHGHAEVCWWYFERGEAYSFRDGALDQVVPFEPVKPFSSG